MISPTCLAVYSDRADSTSKSSMSAPDGLNVYGTCNAQRSPREALGPGSLSWECSRPESHFAKPYANDAEGLR